MATALISDIGGTNSRFQLIAEVSPGVSEIIDRGTLRTMDHDSLSACIAAFLGERPACEFCVIAIAGLNDDHKCWSGSYRWPATSEEDLQKLGFRHVLFLNDLEAAAFGVAQLSPEQTFNINPGTTEVPLAPKGIISHGTGLGISFATAHSGLYFGWHSEHGSSSFGPKGELQSQYTRFLRGKFSSMRNWTGEVTSEMMTSGRNGRLMYEFFSLENPALVDEKSSAEILRDRDRAFWLILSLGSTDADAISSLCFDLYCSILGSLAGDWATKLLARGGMYLTGGVVSHNFDSLVRHQTVIRRWFLSRPRHVRLVLETVPLFVLRPGVELGLMGARVFAERVMAARQSSA